MQQKKEPPRAQERQGKGEHAREAPNGPAVEMPPFDEGYLSPAAPTLRGHLGGQLGLLSALASALLSTYWIAESWRHGLASYLPQLIGGQVFAVALIVGGMAYAGTLGRSWPLFALAGLLAQDLVAVYTYTLTDSAHNSVALLWLVGASGLLLFTYSRHVSLALLGIFNVYASSLLLMQHLPLSGAVCLFSLWTSFFSLIAVLLKCRPIAWAGLYCAPFFFQTIYLAVWSRQDLPPTLFAIWVLFALQIFQTLLFGISIAGYTGSFNQRISPRQTWLYFPITLLGFSVFASHLAPFGVGQILLFDIVCLVLLYGLFIAVASRFLQAPLSDLTMVHVLTAIVSLHALRVLALWMLACMGYGSLALSAVETFALICGACSSITLGIGYWTLSDRALRTFWNRTWSRLSILLGCGLSLYALRLLIDDSFWPFSGLRWLATCLVACTIAASYRLIWQRATMQWNALTSRPGKLALATLFALQCLCWSIAVKSAAQGAVLTLRAGGTSIQRRGGGFPGRG